MIVVEDKHVNCPARKLAELKVIEVEDERVKSSTRVMVELKVDDGENNPTTIEVELVNSPARVMGELKDTEVVDERIKSLAHVMDELRVGEDVNDSNTTIHTVKSPKQIVKSRTLSQNGPVQLIRYSPMGITMELILGNPLSDFIQGRRRPRIANAVTDVNSVF